VARKPRGPRRRGVTGAGLPSAGSRDLRAACLRAAMELLEENGATVLSLRAVARRAGVSPGAPYLHYEARDALISAVAAVGYREVAAHLASAHPHPQPRRPGRCCHRLSRLRACPGRHCFASFFQGPATRTAVNGSPRPPPVPSTLPPSSGRAFPAPTWKHCRPRSGLLSTAWLTFICTASSTPPYPAVVSDRVRGAVHAVSAASGVASAAMNSASSTRAEAYTARRTLDGRRSASVSTSWVGAGGPGACRPPPGVLTLRRGPALRGDRYCVNPGRILTRRRHDPVRQSAV
jgi:AcrR family transcriptional regulator